MNRVMRIGPALALALLSGAVSPAHAQAYKCKQPNGTTSFQAQPCPAGTTGSTLALPPPAPAPEPAARASAARPSWQDAAQESDRRRVDESIKARNDEIEAHNRRVRCNQARQQLGVLKDGRIVYRRDDKGERRYIEDKDRAGEVAAAQRRVAAECN